MRLLVGMRLAKVEVVLIGGHVFGGVVELLALKSRGHCNVSLSGARFRDMLTSTWKPCWINLEIPIQCSNYHYSPILTTLKLSGAVMVSM